MIRKSFAYLRKRQRDYLRIRICTTNPWITNHDKHQHTRSSDHEKTNYLVCQRDRAASGCRQLRPIGIGRRHTRRGHWQLDSGGRRLARRERCFRLHLHNRIFNFAGSERALLDPKKQAASRIPKAPSFGSAVPRRRSRRRSRPTYG